MIPVLALLAVLFFLGLPLLARAEVYRCPGNHYTDKPAAGCVLIEERVSTVPSPDLWRERQQRPEVQPEPEARDEIIEFRDRAHEERMRELDRDRDTTRRH